MLGTSAIQTPPGGYERDYPASYPDVSKAFCRHLSLGNIQPLLRRFREIDVGKKPLWERPK